MAIVFCLVFCSEIGGHVLFGVAFRTACGCYVLFGVLFDLTCCVLCFVQKMRFVWCFVWAGCCVFFCFGSLVLFDVLCGRSVAFSIGFIMLIDVLFGCVVSFGVLFGYTVMCPVFSSDMLLRLAFCSADCVLFSVVFDGRDRSRFRCVRCSVNG